MVELRYGRIISGEKVYEEPKSFYTAGIEKKQEIRREVGTDLAQAPYEIIKGVRTIYEIELGSSSWYAINERLFIWNFEQAQLKQMKVEGTWVDVFIRKLEWREVEGIRICSMELEVV